VDEIEAEGKSWQGRPAASQRPAQRHCCVSTDAIRARALHTYGKGYLDIVRGFAGQYFAGGGTITHHHAVGRVHRPWYDRDRPELFAEALRAAKSALDPAGILNPGVLVGG
jgi:FAD linked oxidases, C-terminal domain